MDSIFVIDACGDVSAGSLPDNDGGVCMPLPGE
jgi:hypothetical protein